MKVTQTRDIGLKEVKEVLQAALREKFKLSSDAPVKVVIFSNAYTYQQYRDDEIGGLHGNPFIAKAEFKENGTKTEVDLDVRTVSAAVKDFLRASNKKAKITLGITTQDASYDAERGARQTAHTFKGFRAFIK